MRSKDSRRMTGRAGLHFTLLSATALVLATAAMAWACTAPVIAAFSVNPNFGENSGPSPVTVEGSCLSNCELDATKTSLYMKLYRAGAVPMPPQNNTVTVFTGDGTPPNRCGASDPVINPVPLVISDNSVSGAGVVPQGKAPGLYYICAGANLAFMWDWYSVI